MTKSPRLASESLRWRAARAARGPAPRAARHNDVASRGRPAILPGMLSEFSIRRAVEFVETDMAGIMHFSNYFRWMEACETAFYRSLELPMISFFPGEVVGWPRVSATCDFRAPLRFNDVVEVKLLVKEIRAKAIVFQFQFRQCDASGAVQPALVARGELTAVCVDRDEKGELRGRPIPAEFRARVAVAPASALAE